MIERRLLGTWVSDGRRTIGDLEKRRKLSAKGRKAMNAIFGKLRLRYTRSRCYSTLDGNTDALPYRVLATNSEGAVLIGRSLPEWLTAEEQIQHVRFVSDNLYWVCLGGIHEYFRRVKTPSNKRMQLTRSAMANGRRGPRS
jgi:hypothetical protein